MAISSVFSASSLGKAVFAAAVPKSVGSAFRIGDDKKAPSEVRRSTILRESATLGQVSVYAALIDSSFNGLKQFAERMPKNGGSHLLVEGLHKMQSNKTLFLIGLSATANILAEAVSRKLAPRNIWKNNDVKALDFAPNAIQPPIQIEICEIVAPAKKSRTLFKSDAKAPLSHHQEVPFTSRPAASVPSPAVNPFQVSRPLPPVARPAFSV